MKSLFIAVFVLLVGAVCCRAQFSETDLRASTAARIRQSFGLELNPEQFSASQLLDIEGRISTARRIQRSFGIKLDYRQFSGSFLLDVESRISASRRLKQNYGLVYDYRNTSLSELLDVEARVSTAQRINRHYGLNLDWRYQSHSALLNQEHAQIKALRGIEATAVRPRVVSRVPGATYLDSRSSGINQPKATSSTSNYSGYSGYSSRYYDSNYRPAVGDHYVAPHVRRDGTFVNGHYRTNRDDSFWNNYSSHGNINPYTGRIGTKVPPSTYRGGSTSVGGYFRSNGTYVSPHFRRSR